MCTVLWSVYHGIEFYDSMVIQCLTFEKLPNCFPQWLQFDITTGNMQVIQLHQQFWPALFTLCLLLYCNPDECEFLSSFVVFTCISLTTKDSEHPFNDLVAFWKCIWRNTDSDSFVHFEYKISLLFSVFLSCRYLVLYNSLLVT